MKKVSRRIITRVFLYIRTLEGLLKEKRETVSSAQLADLTGLTDVQIRKDISFFGKVGTPRRGYQAAELKQTLEDFVLRREVIHVVLFGVGNLGTAILKYPGFRKGKVKLVAAFDVNKGKIGRVIAGVRIYALEAAKKVIRKTRGDIGIIAVPPEKAQGVADLMAQCGLRGIINFAPVSICVPEKLAVKDIDLTLEFLSLFCHSRM